MGRAGACVLRPIVAERICHSILHGPAQDEVQGVQRLGPGLGRGGVGAVVAKGGSRGVSVPFDSIGNLPERAVPILLSKVQMVVECMGGACDG